MHIHIFQNYLKNKTSFVEQNEFIFKLFYHVNGGEMIDINSCFKELDKDINLCILTYEEQVI